MMLRTGFFCVFAAVVQLVSIPFAEGFTVSIPDPLSGPEGSMVRLNGSGFDNSDTYTVTIGDLDVPIQAVTYEGDQNICYVLQNGNAVKRIVTPSIRFWARSTNSPRE